MTIQYIGGPRGLRGQEGPRGRKGPEGPKGNPGPIGPRGPTDYDELTNAPTALSAFSNDVGYVSSTDGTIDGGEITFDGTV